MNHNMNPPTSVATTTPIVAKIIAGLRITFRIFRAYVHHRFKKQRRNDEADKQTTISATSSCCMNDLI